MFILVGWIEEMNTHWESTPREIYAPCAVLWSIFSFYMGIWGCFIYLYIVFPFLFTKGFFSFALHKFELVIYFFSLYLCYSCAITLAIELEGCIILWFTSFFFLVIIFRYFIWVYGSRNFVIRLEILYGVIPDWNNYKNYNKRV